jgi:hypothetical protein
VSALVVHASKDGEESTRTLYTSPVLAVAKGRGLALTGWQVHIVDSAGDIFHPAKFEQLLSFDRKPTRKL